MTRTVNNITPEVFAAIQQRVKQETGVEMTGHEGTASHRGFTVRYLYTEAAQTLTIELVSKPFFIPEKLIASKLDEALSGWKSKQISI